MRFFLLLTLILSASTLRAFAEDAAPIPLDPSASPYMVNRADLEARVAIDVDLKRWKAYNKSPFGGYWYYDTKTLRKSGNKAVVWTTVFPAKGHSEFLQGIYYKHDEINKAVFVTEFRCSEGKYVQPSHTAYNSEGNKLSTSSVSEKEYQWEYIEPESTIDNLFHIACDSGNKKPSKGKK